MAVALGCQRLAGLAVELAVELPVVALGARSLLEVVGVVMCNHLHCDCGNLVYVDSFATRGLHLDCLKMILRQRLKSRPLVLQLRQWSLIFRQRLKSTAMVCRCECRWRCPRQWTRQAAGCDCDRCGLPLAS